MTPLRQRILEDLRIRNLAENTQQSYLQQVSSYARYFGCRPDTTGPGKVREYQVHLVEDCKLAPSSASIAVSPSRFLYKVTLKRPWGAGGDSDAQEAVQAAGDLGCRGTVH